MKYLITFLTFVFSSFFVSQTYAGAPKCHSLHGGYCTYSGKVSKLYINAGNVILMYFDTPLAEGESANAGFTANQPAAVVLLNDNPEFAKLFYSTALAAQASGRDISIQMRGTHAGYLKADRIWLTHQ